MKGRLCRLTLLTVILAGLLGPVATVSADAWSDLAAIRQCESENDYAAVSKNGEHFGAYQFSVSTWYFVGGTGLPSDASAFEQDARAHYLLVTYGRHHWPRC